MANPSASHFGHGHISAAHFAKESVARATPTAVHDHAALAFYTRGRASHFQRHERFELREGDVLLIPAGEPHRLDAARDAAVWGLGFCATFYAASELAPLLDPFERARSGATPIVHIPAERQEHLASVCAELHREVTQGAHSAHSDVVQKSLLSLVLAEVKRAAAFSPPAELQTTLAGEALRFIERHCLEPISLREVAGAVRRSPAHVTTMLRRVTGKSAVAWIIAGRMAEARRRLAHGDELVEVVAERVGYSDVTHFIRLFKRAHGATPAAWRMESRRVGAT